MAEILLSLTIIGVVAAITLPSLTGNINERTWNTQRKALYARMSQAMSLLPSLNGYGKLEDGDPNTVAETFVTAGLSKVLKINNICDNEHIADCGIVSKISDMNGSTISNFGVPGYTLAQYNSMFSGTHYYESDGSVYASVTYDRQIDTRAVAFETANGESIMLFYNPQCKIAASLTPGGFSQPLMCVNMVYDLNGAKGPNTAGKDLGAISVLYAVDPIVVAPLPVSRTVYSTQLEASSVCTNLDPESRVPNKEEAASMFYNKYLWGGMSHWSSSVGTGEDGSLMAWRLSSAVGSFVLYPRDNSDSVRCVKR